MTPNEIEYPVIDGFTLNTLLRCDLTFMSLVIEQYNALRRTRAMRSKSWCVPGDTNSVQIPAFDAYEYELWVKPGSAIWGYTFTGDSAHGDSVQIREACTDVPAFSEFITKQAESTASQQFFNGLIIVPAPGLISVEIATTSATPRQIQLILWGGEPIG